METVQMLGSLGEFVSSIGVLATLIYLATQIKQTQRAINANTFQSTTDTTVHLFSISASSATLSEALAKANADEELTAVESTRVENLWRALIRNYENFFFQWQQGALGEERLLQYGQRLSRMRWRAGGTFLEVWQQDRPSVSEAFATWVEGQFEQYGEGEETS